MKPSSCLGCRTYLEQNEKLPLESMSIEFKNYFLPLKDSKPKWIILKTITGFLNSKGGTIFIGVQDNKGLVIGLEMTRKQQDQFMNFIRTLVERIKPTVDLVNKEQLVVKYIPVVSNKIFKGKYVIKIIVKQGDPSKTYHFMQKIQLQFKGKVEEIQIFHAFYRHNMGGIVQIKGQQLLQEIAKKSAAPNEIANTFHKFCNPDPLKLQGPITKIGFSGIRKEELRIKLEEVFHNHLQKFDIEYDLTYDIENHVLLIQFENQAKCQEINKYIKSRLEDLNKSKVFNFIPKGEYLDFYLYKNVTGSREVSMPKEAQIEESIIENKNISEQKIEIKNRDTQLSADSDNQQPVDLKIQKDIKIQKVKQENFSQNNRRKREKQNQKLKQNSKIQSIAESALTLTITHINSQKMDELIQFVKSLTKNKFEMAIQRYDHTISAKMQNRENFLSFNDLLQKNNIKLKQFGVHGNLVFGVNLKSVRISSYDKNKKKQLQIYIRQFLHNDYEEIEFKKSNNKFFLECRFDSEKKACEWLDKMLIDNNLQQFAIEGSQTGLASKMRIYLNCAVS